MDKMLAHAIDALMARMARNYGAHFAAMWPNMTAEQLAHAMAQELGVFRHRLDAIAWTADHLPERCPNLPQLRALCRQAPNPEATAKAAHGAPTRAPSADEARRLRALAADIRNGRLFARPGRHWAEGVAARDPGACTLAQLEMATSIMERADHAHHHQDHHETHA